MYLNMAGAGEVHKTINSFKTKATGDAKIDALKIANTSHNFTNVLAMIINKKFQEGDS